MFGVLAVRTSAIPLIRDCVSTRSAISKKLFSENKPKLHLSDIADVIMGQSPSSSSYNEKCVGLPLVQGNLDIENGKTVPRFYTSEITQVARIGDILLTVRAPVGEVAITEEDICIGRGVCAICPKNIEDKEFIYQYLIYYKPLWSKLEQGSTFTAVSGKEIKNITSSIPREVSILTDIDEKIVVEKKIAYLLHKQKQCLLRQMFI